jgi:hypothetical protein
MPTASSLTKLLLILVICSLFTNVTAQVRELQLSARGNQTTLQSNNEDGFSVLYSVGTINIDTDTTRAGDFDRLSIEGFGQAHRLGEPQLPVSSRIVAVPLGAELSFEVLRREDVLISAQESKLKHQIMPAQAPISKSADISTIPFDINEALYRKNSMTGGELFQAQELGILRGVRLFLISFEPIRYNPQTSELEVCLEAEIRVGFENPDFVATQNMRAKTASVEFEQLYAKTIFNWQPDRNSLVRQPTKMTLLCPPAYETTMQPYLDWKRKQGYTVNLVTVGTGADVANSTSAITTYMANLWSSATASDPAPTYLVIVGDTSTSGNNVIAASGVTATHPTDLSYVRLQGTDYLPEMYFGRFSVSSATELTRIVNKSIMFQQTAMPDLSYLGQTVLIAGVDASFAPTHGNGAINYATTHYFNSTHGINSNNYLYPASGSSATQIHSNAAEGRGYMNYTAHGSQTSWANPSFTAAQMTALTNVDKPFVAVGNCCITNEFDYSSPCFGEAIIRAENAGVAYIGGTNSTYWDEDYYWAVGYKSPQTEAHPYNPNTLGAYDAMFQVPTSVDDWAQTTGETIFMGNMAVQQSGSSRADYYWEIYSIMGDPSLMPYYGEPVVNNASFPDAIMIGIDSINISAAPQSRVALSMDGTLVGTGIVGSSGSLSLDIDPFTNPGIAELVITRSGMITRIEEIDVLPASGPFMTVETTIYGDSNNQLAEYDESGFFNVTFANVGADAVSSVNATLSSTTNGISITDASESIASLAAGASITRYNAFAISISDSIADDTMAEFTITMESGDDIWTHPFTLNINAPALAFGSYTILDPEGNGNGRLDPGETVTLTIPVLNEGGAASPSGSASLSSPTPGITINTDPVSFSSIAAGSSRNISFSLSAAPEMSIGTIAFLSLNTSAGAYAASAIEEVPVGLILEDFESGDFSAFPWEMTGELPWTIDSSEQYQGNYAAQSGSITHSETSSMKTTRILSSPGTISFWYKVSSESGYDYLRFYVDGTQIGQWAGTVDWTEATFELAAGSRELTWTYSKDGSVSSGSDCAWVDYIIFPASTTPSSFYPPRNLTATPSDGRISLNWQAPNGGTPSSYQIFKDGSLLTTVTALSYQDNAVTNGTEYSYYVVAVYPLGNSDPSNTVAATPGDITEVIIGTETSATGGYDANPINIWYKSLHGQSIYTAAELNSAGMSGQVYITQLGFYVEGAPLYALPSFLIRMKHSSDANVINWQSADGMQTVYTTASYTPTAGGYDMISLDTPFQWNGVDNIVVDTAFGLMENYNSSGSLQTSTLTNGYRYIRSDSSDQSNAFSGGSTVGYRPNIKLVFQTSATNEALISTNPASLDFDDTIVGSSSSQTLRISNLGDIELSGSITTPTGYSINQRSSDIGDKDQRNTINFSISAGSHRDYAVVFAPIADIAYNADIVITSNAANHPLVNIPVRGSGYRPPTISLDSNDLNASLLLGEETSDSFTITNTGGQELTFSIALSEQRSENSSLSAAHDSRSITGSYLSVNPDSYQAGTTVEWEISVFNGSTDAEWIKEVILEIPGDIIINDTGDMTCASGILEPTIEGNTITWFGESGEWGIIHGSETATATISISIPAGLHGDIILPYTLNGDMYNDEPHTLSDTVILTQDAPPVEWMALSAYSGSLAAGASAQITASFSAVGMSEGTYHAMVNISSNDPENPELALAAEMEVFDHSNHPPVIDLPESFSFDKNGSLQIDLANYASDPDNDPLSVQILGNTNVLYDISGMLVTLTAMQNWVGSETLSFVVSDGELSASDQALINVLPVNEPQWTPVNYPNNPATIYAAVSIEGYPAMANDWLAAFVGDECRGIAEIVPGRDNAYATLIVQMAEPGETVYFRVYSYLADTIYDANLSVQPEYGEEIGSDTPLQIDAGILSSLDPPVVSIISDGSTLQLSWEAVLHADYYEIYSCDTLDAEFELLYSTTDTSFALTMNQQRTFFRVKACKGVPVR